MEVKGVNEKEVSEKENEEMQSKICNQEKVVIKTEIQHFTDTSEIQHFAIEKVRKNDNVYGVTWGNVVREYLKTAYTGETAEAEVVLWDVTYKVLKRDSVTSFYDADGNTLFDVENTRLAKEYVFVMKESGEPKAIPKDESAKPLKEKAKEKLEAELKSAKEKSFAEPVINYLLKRCDEDNGLAEDVTQKHKTWEKCYSYIYSKARDQSKGNCAAVRDDVVYEWAEDYYHQDDKAAEEKKAKEAENLKKHKSEVAKKASINSAPTTTKKGKDSKKPEEPKPKKNSKDMEGQMDLFSLVSM